MSKSSVIASLVCALILAACSLPFIKGMPTVTPTPATESHQCGFMWASQYLPEVTAEIQNRMAASDLRGVTITAEAYGENCIDSQSNKVVSFAAMETDFRATVDVTDLQNKKLLGDILEKVLVVLDGFPPGKVPGPQPGLVAVSFRSGEDQLNLQFTITDGKSAREKGLAGPALIAALEK